MKEERLTVLDRVINTEKKYKKSDKQIKRLRRLKRSGSIQYAKAYEDGYYNGFDTAKSETLKKVFEIINKEEIFGEDDLTFKYLILQKLKELEPK